MVFARSIKLLEKKKSLRLCLRKLQIFYLVVESPQEEERKIEEETEVVLATYTSYSLIFLDKFTKYKIQILAFNPAGDGPRSDAVFVKTHPVRSLGMVTMRRIKKLRSYRDFDCLFRDHLVLRLI